MADAWYRCGETDTAGPMPLVGMLTMSCTLDDAARVDEVRSSLNPLSAQSERSRVDEIAVVMRPIRTSTGVL